MKKINLYNPLKTDFTVQWAGEGYPRDYTIPAGEIGTFPEPLAKHLLKHLAELIIQTRGVKTNHDDDIEDIKREIAVEI